MHTDTEHLKSIAKEIAVRQNTKQNIELNADPRLQAETIRLEKAITAALRAFENLSQRNTFHNDILGKLIDVSDILFEPQNMITQDVQVLLQLLTAIKQIIPGDISPHLRLPKAFVLEQKLPTVKWWDEYLPILQQQNIHLRLMEIAAIPFTEFSEPKHKLYWGNYIWLKAYERKLESLDWLHTNCNSKTEALVSMLIGSGFNDDRFFIYCKDIIVARCEPKKGRREKLKELANCRKLVLQDSRIKCLFYNPKADPLTTQLLAWIAAEEEYINIHEPEHPFSKLSFQFYKYTLAFFFKLLHEQKVFGDITYRELTEQIASTCTAMGANVPADTMIKKAYLKKQVDFRAIETLLVNMLAYIRSFMTKA